jgi:hypothetical protein
MIILHLFYKKNGPYDYEIWTRILLHYTIIKNGQCNGRKDSYYAHTKYHGIKILSCCIIEVYNICLEKIIRLYLDMYRHTIMRLEINLYIEKT